MKRKSLINSKPKIMKIKLKRYKFTSPTKDFMKLNLKSSVSYRHKDKNVKC